MILDKFYIKLFNILDELVFICDYKTSEIIFINDKCKNMLNLKENFNIKNNDIKCEEISELFKSIKNIDNNSNDTIEYNNIKYFVNKIPSIHNNNNVILYICNKISEDDKVEKLNKKFNANDILIESIKILNNNENFQKSIDKILEIIGIFYLADKVYIFENLTEPLNTYIWDRFLGESAEDMLADNEKLIKYSKDKDFIFIEDINEIKNIYSRNYNLSVNISNICACSVKFLEQYRCTICVENIKLHKDHLSLVNSLIYFILNELKKEQISKQLKFVNSHDALTGLNNKYKYENYIENINLGSIKSLAIAFVDINGLNKINLNFGKEAGDKAIITVANSIKKSFRKNDCYRIDEDNFVILSENISKEKFIEKLNNINKYFLELREYSISIGYIWRDKNIDVNECLNKTDLCIHQIKQSYYNTKMKYKIDIFSCMGTYEEDSEDNIVVSLGHDLSLDFNTNFSPFTTKQEIFNFKTQQLLLNNDCKEFAIIMFDINNFKAINEIYGIKEGNKILYNIGNVSNKLIFGKGFCCHMYSDVFYVCIETKNDVDTLKIINNLDNEIKKINSDIKFILSYGIYRIDSDILDIEDFCERASYAHKLAKKNLVKNIVFYDDFIKASILYEKQIENEMEQALNDNQFKLYLQPKYSLPNEVFNSAEALIRWYHPTKGIIPPSKFIPIFEKNGFIINIDMYILEQVCIFIKNNEKLGRKNIPISVNMSKLHFSKDNFVSNIINTLIKYDVDPKLIEIEITESLLAQNIESFTSIINELKSHNITVAIDDFGTGYSSFGILKNFDIDTLKIDKSFFKDFEKNKKASSIIKAIILLSKELNLSVVAEGVENKIEVDYLKEIHCDIIQGYYFSKPLPLEEFENLIFKNK